MRYYLAAAGSEACENEAGPTKSQDSSKGGAVEAGCSDLYAAIH